MRPRAAAKAEAPAPAGAKLRAGVAVKSRSAPSARSPSALAVVEADLHDVETRLAELEAALRKGEDPMALKTQLAQIETEAQRLEGRGLDAVHTGELDSGRAEAEAKKRELSQRFEAMHAKIEKIFKEIKHGPEFAIPSGRLSKVSNDALVRLATLDQELSGFEERVLAISAQVAAGDASSKSELAQIESKLKQMETTGVDDVYTGDLESGKQMAKAAKKDMLRRFEVLFEKIDAIFAEIKKT